MNSLIIHLAPYYFSMTLAGPIQILKKAFGILDASSRMLPYFLSFL